MRKNYLLLLATIIVMSGNIFAQVQRCGSDEKRKQLIITNPEILRTEEAFNQQIRDGLNKIDFKIAHKTTDTLMPDSFWYDIPIVVHVIHDFGAEYMSDNRIFNDVKLWNIVYAGANTDTNAVIKPFKKWVGNPHIRLHLATIDPLGQPTKGITRHRSYLTYNGTDQSKLDDWPNASYMNIWFVNSLKAQGTFQPAAYAYFPSMGDAYPALDGVISFYSYDTLDKTINHELGHTFSLYHPWGNTNGAAAGLCSDGGSDEVDDTPPTLGHLSCDLYDTTCATNYFKIYLASTGYDSLVDYPDTTNVQNIMDYSYCSKMFTKGQVVRMHTALGSDVGHRSNLWSPTNLGFTGALSPVQDLTPIPDFNAVDSIASIAGPHYFTCPFPSFRSKIKFLNQSWNDTISTVRWQFTNGARVDDITIKGSSYLTNNFSQPGWVTLTMTATDTTGTTTGGRTPNSGTKVFPNAVFVTDAVGVDPNSYFQEFNPAGDLAKWPIFNYYNNEFKWQTCNTTGFYDNYCMQYVGFDTRLNPPMGIYPFTGSPSGDFDDFFSVPFDLSSFDSACNLNFYYSGASRSSTGLNVNDSLEIQYSNDSSLTWHTLFVMKKNILCNMGAVTNSYAPLWQGDWSPMSINIPLGQRTSYTIFRFRYHPGVGTDGFSSGNNFYLDRINVSKFTAAVSNIKTDNMDVVVAPNPTSGNAYVIINNKNATSAKIVVTDITGKIVYSTTEQIGGMTARIEIPQNAIAVSGIYLVQTITGNNTCTRKLVVY